MRLRYTLVVIMGLIAIIPALGLGFWTRHHLETAQFDDVRDRHLLLARNLEQAMSRYYRDIVSSFDMLAGVNTEGVPTLGHEHLARNLGFRHICSYRAADATLLGATGFEATHCGDYLDPALFAELKAQAEARPGEVVITPVMKTRDGLNRLNVVRLKGDRLCIGSLETSYFIRLGESVKFGDKGHAAIIDQAGNLLAHPLPSWIAEAKNISKLSVAQRMMAGETGIEQFFSPALKGDMIAGFTHIAGPGWGVMIPQPVVELEAHAADALRPIWTIIGIALASVLAIAFALARRLAKPLEAITAAAQKSRATGIPVPVECEGQCGVVHEHRAVVEAYDDMVAAIRDSHARMQRLAYTDSLSGLLNRAAFTKLARPMVEDMLASNKPGCLVYFDLDGFKAINDTHGHACGDRVLEVLSQRVKAAVSRRYDDIDAGIDAIMAERRPDRDTPLVARIGGDEFTMLLPGLGEKADIEAFAGDLAAVISEPIRYDDIEIVAATSVGAACLPCNVTTLDEAMKRADVALYHAKMRRKGGCCVYDADEGIRSLAEIRADVSRAIDAGEMELFYQPKVASETGEVHSVEALIRWRHPERGLVPPFEFIPPIEQSGVVVKLGEWVVRQAARDILTWQAQGRSLKVAVNIGARHFTEEDFAERVRQIVAEVGVDAASIELEITEEAATGPLDAGRDVIGALKQAGFTIALDDYGRGYSNLNRLAELNVDKIKIDRSLIESALVNDRTRHIVTATTRMAEALDCEVCAEGIEDAGQAALLRRLGCHELQGYYFSRPLPVAEFNAWLEARDTPEIIALQRRIASAIG